MTTVNIPLLAIDVGNTSTVLGLLQSDGTPIRSFRIRTDRDALPDNYALMIRSLLDLAKVPEPHSAIISSVAPPVGQNIMVALQEYWGIQVIEVGHHNLDVQIDLKDPTTVGADRLVNMFGVWEHVPEGRYAIIVDFGTATTFDAIQSPRRFMGGVIAPGPSTAADALFNKTAKLPRVPLVAPPAAIGRTTPEAIQSGLVYGYVEMVDGMIRRLGEEMPEKPIVVATGGFARTLKGLCRNIDVYDDDVTIKGLINIWHEHAED